MDNALRIPGNHPTLPDRARVFARTKAEASQPRGMAPPGGIWAGGPKRRASFGVKNIL